MAVDEKCELVRGEDGAGTMVNVREGTRFVKMLRERAGKIAVALVWRSRSNPKPIEHAHFVLKPFTSSISVQIEQEFRGLLKVSWTIPIFILGPQGRLWATLQMHRP